MRRVFLACGLLALAVDRAAGRAEYDASAGRTRRFQDANGADNVDVRVEGRTLHRCPYVSLCREMEDHLGPEPAGKLLERLVTDVELVQLYPRRQVLTRSARKIVHDVDFGRLCNERIDEMRADESRPSGDDRSQLPAHLGIIERPPAAVELHARAQSRRARRVPGAIVTGEPSASPEEPIGN